MVSDFQLASTFRACLCNKRGVRFWNQPPFSFSSFSMHILMLSTFTIALWIWKLQYVGERGGHYSSFHPDWDWKLDGDVMLSILVVVVPPTVGTAPFVIVPPATTKISPSTCRRHLLGESLASSYHPFHEIVQAKRVHEAYPVIPSLNRNSFFVGARYWAKHSDSGSR
jgi:hypothetical protein